MNVLKSASSWLAKQRKSFASEQIEYVQSEEDSSHSLLASIGKTIFRIDDNISEITTRIVSFDFIVSSEDVDFEPQKGDTIIYDGGKYEVLAPNDEPVWRWCSASMDSLRIHTKYVGALDEFVNN